MRDGCDAVEAIGEGRVSSPERPAGAGSILRDLFLALPAARRHHAPGSGVYAVLKHAARQEVERLFRDPLPTARPFPPFGQLALPYHQMGAVDSLDLFGLDELIIFSFYWIHRHRYRRVLDIGANIGLHSILLSRCGYEVRAYEPDPQHFERLQANLALNQCVNVEAYPAAVSSASGVMEFVRVLGNTTGNHLLGSKPNPYGPLERFPVVIEAIGPALEWADLLKVDAEGHEKTILLATRRDQWLSRDAVVEVGNAENAAAIFEHFRREGVHLFSQKTGWRRVREVSQMPTSHRDGALFISGRPAMSWGAGRMASPECDAMQPARA